MPNRHLKFCCSRGQELILSVNEHACRVVSARNLARAGSAAFRMSVWQQSGSVMSSLRVHRS